MCVICRSAVKKVTEAGNRGDDGYGDRTKAEYCSRIHTSVSVDWTVTKNYLEITSEDEISWIFC